MVLLAVTLIIAALMETLIFIIALGKISNKLDDIKTEREKFISGIIESLSLYLNRIKEYELRRDNTLKEVNKKLEEANENNKKVNDTYKEVVEVLHELLDDFRETNTQYSNLYDQLALINKKLERTEEKIDRMIFPVALCEYYEDGKCTEANILEEHGYDISTVGLCEYSRDGYCTYTDMIEYQKVLAEKEKNNES